MTKDRPMLSNNGTPAGHNVTAPRLGGEGHHAPRGRGKTGCTEITAQPVFEFRDCILPHNHLAGVDYVDTGSHNLVQTTTYQVVDDY